MHGTIHPDGPSVTAVGGGAPLPTLSVTPADLASALASIATDQSLSQPSSLQSSLSPRCVCACADMKSPCPAVLNHAFYMADVRAVITELYACESATYHGIFPFQSGIIRTSVSPAT